ncbi:MAG: leucine-rich repeat domain-containing protein [Sedimentisphaerales bacterium]|nr:leucine-rich repeat domain-containing protein [Sedimentisphaerales bacterium]
MTADMDIIRRLEKKIGKKLERLEENGFSKANHAYFIDDYGNITELILIGSFITNISFLKRLRYLTKLNLSANLITNISFLKGLTNLTELNLGYNGLSDISPLQGLKNLSILSLYHNNTTDLSPLQGLKNLTELYLWNNQLTDLSPLEGLTNLTELNLPTNNITDLSPLRDLKNLKNLDLAGNEITDLSPLQDLKNLKNLNLAWNEITDISPLRGPKNLTKLDLRTNRIKRFPPELLEFGMQVVWESASGKGINLCGNPLESPPVEIVEQGMKAIREYFKSLGKEEKKLLNEMKVLLVGDGGAGKTSLVKRLVYKTFDPAEKQTHGVYRDDWSIKIGRKEVKVHFWDFGGQGIMQAAHQLFFSVRSLYVLVMNARQEPDPEDWFRRIESFGGDSPVMVVINKVDENRYNLNEKDLQRKYPAIKGFYHVSCKKRTGIADFKKALKKQISEVKMIQTELPLSWFEVKKDLEELRKEKPYITLDEYKIICVGADVTESEACEILIRYLHILGVALHYEDYDLLNTQVLNPEWVTQAIYKIINSQELKKQDGILPKSRLSYILNEEVLADFAGKAVKYSPEEERYIVQLMKKFELCFELDGGGIPGRILVPDLLKAEESDYDFPKTDVLRFYFEYDFLPSSVLPSFMVKRQQDVDIDLCWRTGLVMSDKEFDARALVRLDKNKRRIHIQVAGAQKRDYFSTIRKTIMDINAGFQKLPVRQWVPLPDEDGYAVEYDELLGHEKINPRRDKIFIGKLGREYPVSVLLDGIETPEERRERIKGARGVKIRDIHAGQVIFADDIGNIETHRKVKKEKTMKINKVDVHGNATFADKIGAIVYNQNFDIPQEKFSELIAGIKGLAAEKQRLIENDFKDITKAKTEHEKESIAERIKAFLIANAIPVAHSLTATAIFELAKMFV